MLILVPVLLAAPQTAAPRPLPFRFQAPPAYGEPDRAEDRTFDTWTFTGKDGKPFAKEGRYYFRQWHYRKDSGEEKPTALWVHRNIENALKGAGAELLYNDGRQRLCARAVSDGSTIWIYVSSGSDWWEMRVIQEEAMKQVFSAEFLGSAIEKDGYVALDVHFRTDSAEILAESGTLLDRAAEALKAHENWKISVEGHTDNTGQPAHNKTLSEQRARSVAAALQQRGIAAARLKSAGFGAERPVADNRTEDGKAKNRRVELVRQ
jgi:outer membrane protein OmpA-like peptidoglycan-associated protein